MKTLKKTKLKAIALLMTLGLIVIMQGGITNNVKAANPTFAEQFPDPLAAQAIAEYFNKSIDDEISDGDINTDNLLITNLELKDITGISIFSQLKHLDVMHTKLESLPKEISSLDKLKYLHIFESELTNLPEEITTLSNLNTLIVQYGKLTKLPENIGDLQNLEFLVLNSNLITSLPDSIGNLNAYTIELQDNQLTNLPKSIMNLPADTSLYPYYNLLPADTNEQLADLGIISHIETHNSLQLALIGSPIIEVKRQSDIDDIDYMNMLEIVNIELAPYPYLPELSPAHNFTLENYYDEDMNPVDINEYIKNGIIIQDGILFAQVRATGEGILEDPGTFSITKDYVELHLETTPYNLSFDLNGGEGNIPEVQILLEGELAISVSDPIREGYSFIGWNTSADGSGTIWDFSTKTMPNEDITLYAIWEINEVKEVNNDEDNNNIEDEDEIEDNSNKEDEDRIEENTNNDGDKIEKIEEENNQKISKKLPQTGGIFNITMGIGLVAGGMITLLISKKQN